MSGVFFVFTLLSHAFYTYILLYLDILLYLGKPMNEDVMPHPGEECYSVSICFNTHNHSLSFCYR